MLDGPEALIFALCGFDDDDYRNIEAFDGFSVSEIVAMLNAISKDLVDIVVSETNKNVVRPHSTHRHSRCLGESTRGALPWPKRQ